MSFSGRTPESLLPRSDSKDPATTCKGLTTNGRPCRRGLAVPPKSSPLPSPSGIVGGLAFLDGNNAAAFYCWQHKDQAENLDAQPEQRTSSYPLKQRSSIDTLVDRVGILTLDEEVSLPRKSRHRQRRSDGHHLTRRDNLPSGWHSMHEPLMTVPEQIRPARRPAQKQYTYGRSNVKASWTCCITADDDDDPPSPRPRPHRNNGAAQAAGYTSPSPMHMSSAQVQVRRKLLPSQQPQMAQQTSSALRSSPQPTNSHPNCQTQALLSLMPRTLSPQITSALLAELCRPISSHDEAGFIYIFWLTPESEASKPDDETASSLLDEDDETYSSVHRQRTTTALQRYASVRKTSAPRTILLKIGRAANVHRRLSQWTKQCGQNITVIRFYPYSSIQRTASASPSGSARKVPHVHKVERLIHLELAEKRAQKNTCEQCGREHREWFEVEASKAGLKGVNEVVTRWIGWAERVDGHATGHEGTMGGREIGNARPKGREEERSVIVPLPTAVDGYY